jgi:hypothetical protein
MSDNLCVRCDRPTPDGYACSSCAYRAGDQLHELADMAPAATDRAYRLGTSSSGVGSSGKPGSRIPLDLRALAELNGVENALSGWARIIADERGVALP